MTLSVKQNRFLLLSTGLALGAVLALSLASCTKPKTQQELPIKGKATIETPEAGAGGEVTSKTLLSLPSDTFKSTALWYPRANGFGYMQVIRPLNHPVKGKELALKLTLQQLLEGPTEKETAAGIFSEIPKHVQLKGLRLSPKQNIVTLYLSPNFEEGGGSYSIQARVEQLRQTVRTFYPKAELMLVLSTMPHLVKPDEESSKLELSRMGLGTRGLIAPEQGMVGGVIGGEGLEVDATSKAEGKVVESKDNDSAPKLKTLDKSSDRP